MKITEKEFDVLNAIVMSDYNSSCEATPNYPIWMWDVSDNTYGGKTFSGLVSRLTEKGLVGTHIEKKKDDSIIWATELGIEIYNEYNKNK